MQSQYLVACILLGAGPLLGCGAPKQVAPPPILDSEGEDIAPEEEKVLEPEAKMPDEMSTDEKKTACCRQCAKGLAADRTGQPADQIPCADFTSTLEDFCLEYFRTTPLQASECQSSAPDGADAPSPDGEPPSPDAPPAEGGAKAGS
jgi:hypothetical protein